MTGEQVVPTSLRLVRTWIVVGVVEGDTEIVGQGVGGGDRVT
jgi:hypothetical protein